MNRVQYLEKRKSRKITLEDLYETLILNPTFKIKNLSLFIDYYNLIVKAIPNTNNILFQEFKRLNDNKFTITTLHDKKGKELLAF